MPGGAAPAVLDYERVVPRHAVIVGRSGSGKSHSLQVIAEENVRLGVPTVCLDMTGDLVAFAARRRSAGSTCGPAARSRCRWPPSASGSSWAWRAR